MNIDQIQSILGAEIECGVFESVVVPALDVCRKVADSSAATVGDAASVALTDERIIDIWCNTPTTRFGGEVEDQEIIDFARALLAASQVATTAGAQDEWKLAIDNELVTIESTADSFPSPREALAALIDWHVSAALDPAVSKDAQALIDEGRAASSPVNLEGLREKLLTPRAAVRDEDGRLWHPDYPVCDEGTRADKFLEAFGIETAFVTMEGDAPDLAERWHEEGLSDCSEWMPKTPDGDGWLLLEIYDTEDGPCAMYGRDFYAAEKARKQESRRVAREERRAASSATAPLTSDSDAVTDTERLDFMLENDAFTVRCNRDSSILQYQLMTQDEDENYHVLHNERRFFNTERDAIDEAIRCAQSTNGEQS